MLLCGLICVLEDGGSGVESVVDGGRGREEEGKAAYFIDFSALACGIGVESEAH